MDNGSAKNLVLVVDDDQNILSLVHDMLVDAGYQVKMAASAFQARGAIVKLRPDLIILDRGIPDAPGAEGIHLMQEIRSQQGFENIPILFLSARGTSADKTQGLKLGGDDYLAKPFSRGELLARVEALLRRVRRPAEPLHVLRGKGILVDLDRRIVEVHRREVTLPPKEFELLVALLEKPGRVLNRRFLLQRVWGEGMELRMNSKTVDVAVGRLREALGPIGDKIVAVQGMGYRFDVEE